jgi:hypothetical protein
MELLLKNWYLKNGTAIPQRGISVSEMSVVKKIRHID